MHSFMFVVMAVRDGGDTPVFLTGSLGKAREWARDHCENSDGPDGGSFDFNEVVKANERVRFDAPGNLNPPGGDWLDIADWSKPQALSIMGFEDGTPVLYEVVDYDPSLKREEYVL